MNFIVVNLSGEILGRFYTQSEANNFADQYGDDTGRFAYVEFESE